MENYQATLNGMDLELRRVNDTRLDTIRRTYPHNVAVNADIRREILEEISREEEPGEFWPLQHPARVQSTPIPEAIRFSPLRQELFNVEESANDGTDTRHYAITLGGNAPRYQHSWVQELAMQNIIFESLLVVNPEDKLVGPPSTTCISDEESDADEEDNIKEISKGLEELDVHLSNQKRGDGSSQETDEGADGDDEDSSFEPSEPEYVFVNPGRRVEEAGSWNQLRAWNGYVRRGSRCPSPVGGGSGQQ